jgi:hypothetical protein
VTPGDLVKCVNSYLFGSVGIVVDRRLKNGSTKHYYYSVLFGDETNVFSGNQLELVSESR